MLHTHVQKQCEVAVICCSGKLKIAGAPSHVTRHLQYVNVTIWPPMSCAAPSPPSAAAAAAAAAAADAEDELPVLSSRLEYLSNNYKEATA
jgi:hypothetical protein